MYEPFRGAPDICPGIAVCGYLMPVTTKENPRSRPAVWTIPSSQLAWATKHVDVKHTACLEDSEKCYAVITFRKGTAARDQFTLFGGRERYNSKFRSALTVFVLLESPDLCARRLYRSYDRVPVTNDMWYVLKLSN